MDFHFDPDQYNNGDGKKKLTKKQRSIIVGMDLMHFTDSKDIIKHAKKVQQKSTRTRKFKVTT